MRHLDHIVWPTRHLGALAETFRRLGFTVGRRNRHPWGTENHIVQFDGVFLELLGFADDFSPVSPDDPAHPFVTFCTDVLARSAGRAAMLVLRSDDAESDAARFRAQGLGAGNLLAFSRTAQGPDGRDRTVAFTVAFAALPGLPEIGAFVCQHHRPENFWSPAAQRHANGATGLDAVIVETRDVAAAASALRRFAGSEARADEPEGDSIRLGDSTIVVTASQSGDMPTGGRSHVAALHVAVDDLALLQGLLDGEGLPYTPEAGRLKVAAATAGGTDLVFASARTQLPA